MNRGSVFTSMTLERSLVLVFLASVFLLALCKIEDVDAWLHLVYGKAIWEMKGIPQTEPYVYSMIGKPFLYTSWLFGVLYYGLYQAFSFTGVILFKATLISTVFYVLLKDSLRPNANVAASVLILTAVALMARHRFVERPDTFLFLFLSFSIFSLNAFVYDNKKYLYALPLVHLLWANSHTSISLMFLPFGAFLAGGIIQRYFNEKRILSEASPSPDQLKTVLYLLLASFLASLINPNFIHQYTLGVQYLGNEWFKQNIAELMPATWTADKTFFVFAPFVLISFIASRRRIFIPHILLLLPVLYLAITSRRFISVFVILAGPILVRNLTYGFFQPGIDRQSAVNRRLVLAGAVLVIVLAASFTIAQVKPFGNLEKAFGFGVNSTRVPEGALAYMDGHNITGRVLNTFAWGQYMLWRDGSRRQVIVDGRVNIPLELLDSLTQAKDKPAVLDDLEQRYGFNAILISYNYDKTRLKRPGPKGPFDAALNHPGWALVYWDDLALLYVRKDGPYASVAHQDEYHLVKPANNIDLLEQMLRNRNERDSLLRELRRNIAETGSMTGIAYLGHCLNLLGQYREAIACFEIVLRDAPHESLVQFSYTSIAHAHEMLGDYAAASTYYELALREQDGDAEFGRIVRERMEHLQSMMRR